MDKEVIPGDFMKIPEFPNYVIDQAGRVYSLTTLQFVKPIEEKRRYYQLFKKGKRYNRGVPGLIRDTFGK